MEINHDVNKCMDDNEPFNLYDSQAVQENWNDYIKQCRAHGVAPIRYDLLKLKAVEIVSNHIAGFMQGCNNYIPNDDDELYETMVEECSYILTKKLLDKEFLPVEYNFIRNELATILRAPFDHSHQPLIR